jgi:hypothetical protein
MRYEVVAEFAPDITPCSRNTAFWFREKLFVPSVVEPVVGVEIVLFVTMFGV